MNKVVLDTNILLETPEILENKNNSYVISAVTLKELDSLKRKRGDLAYSVRLATRMILEHFSDIEFDIPENFFTDTNDDLIIEAAKRHGVLYTEDVLMTVIARAQGVPVQNPLSAAETDYKGFIELEVEDSMTDLINDYYGRPAHTTKGFAVKSIMHYIDRLPEDNEYVLLKYKEDYMIFKYDEEEGYFVKRQLPGRKLRVNGHDLAPLDAYQHMALLSAINMDIPMTIIDGPVGSGKTLLALAAALHLYNNNKMNKIYITRPPVGVDHRYNIGFLPGTQDEKLNPWVGGIISNLEFLYDKGAEAVFKESFQHFPVNTAQGYSIHQSVLIVDESQLLSIDLMKQIVSRVSQGSKLILLGDENQSYKVVARAEMGLRRLKQLLPTPHVEYVKLDKIYRGALAELSLRL